MYYFCTYFDKNYLDKGLALYQSLCTWNQPFTLWILCLDDDVYRTLNEKQLPFITLISIADFEWEDKRLAEAKQNRTLIEYYFTCTSVLLSKILKTNPKIDILTYLDADVYFFAPIKPVYDELKKGSIVIVGHNFPESLKHLEKYGKYNVGLVSFRNNRNGLTCLNWWNDRCLEWCYDRLEDGKFADQKYLDDWPERFPGVIVCQNIGVGLAPWNLANYKEQQPVIMYHFHDVRKVSAHIWDSGVSPYGTIAPDWIRDTIYLPYLKELEKHKGNNHSEIRKTTKLLQNYFKKVLYKDYIILM